MNAGNSLNVGGDFSAHNVSVGDMIGSANESVHKITSDRGQGADLLEKRSWDVLSGLVILASYSTLRSCRTAAS